MANGNISYSLYHAQIAAQGETPTWVDLPYARTLNPTINQDEEDLQADGANVLTAYDGPRGSLSAEWARATPAVLALMAGLTATSSGTTPATIDRLEYKGDTTPPGIMLSAWALNIDPNIDGAGMRITFPNVKLKVPSMPLAQKTFSTLSADGNFNPNAAGVMMILEFLETAPTFTSNVMPVNLTAPS